MKILEIHLLFYKLHVQTSGQILVAVFCITKVSCIRSTDSADLFLQKFFNVNKSLQEIHSADRSNLNRCFENFALIHLVGVDYRQRNLHLKIRNHSNGTKTAVRQNLENNFVLFILTNANIISNSDKSKK